MTDDEVTPDEIVEVPLKVEIMNHKEDIPIKDLTSWEEEDPWDFTKMTEEDIKEAEEARNG